ncbi:MAG TPA: hypothetical protein VF268_05065 [Gammaproteobacteria bacterium]|jgi:type II secretory pathway component GspD/PulD (secretin)
MMTKRLPLIIVLLLLFPGGVPAQPAEIIDLHNRTAEEMIPIIRPFMNPGDALTGADYQLIIRTDPENLASIRDMIARLDKAPAQLLISVKNSGQSDRVDSALNAGGALDRDGRRITINDRGESEGIRIEAGRTASSTGSQQTPQIRATEGRPALIYTGVSVPVRSRQQLRQGNRVIEQELVEYRNVNSGLYVTARLNRDEVVLEVEPQQQSLGASGGINTFGLSTTLRGRLGEWIPLGAVTENSIRQLNRPGAAASNRSENRNNVMIRVEKIEN